MKRTIEVIEKIRNLLKSEKFEEANILIHRAIVTDRTSPDLLNLKGQLLLQTGNFEEATKIFSDITELWEDNIEALNGLATCLIYQNNWDAGMNLLLKILEMDPSNAVAKENLEFVRNEISVYEAKDLLQKGHISEGKKILETVLRSDEKHIEALNYFTTICIDEDNFEEADKRLSVILKLDPTNKSALRNFEDLKKKCIEKYQTNSDRNWKEDREQVLISVHIPKCGGTSFSYFLKKIYGDALFLDYGLDWALQHGTSLTMTKSPRCVHGHFFSNKYDSIFPSASLITWVRHPVQIVASRYFFYLRYPRLGANNPICALVHERKLSLIDFAHIDVTSNRMTLFFAGKSLKDFNFVGIVEFYKESLYQFCEMIGVPCPPDIPYENVNKDRKNASYDISKAEFDEILELNSLDFALYEKALDNFYSRRQSKTKIFN